jgi:AcrR family transcriptional regulator
MKSKQTPKRNAGRNPTINRESIAAAVRETTAQGPVSVNKVAAHLGVNVTTVYRHTGGLEGLRRIHALQSFESQGEAPEHEGLSWQKWLFRLANFYRDAFLQHSDLLKYAQVALDPRFQRLEQATKVLIGYGFSAQEAVRAHAFLINNVVGYVHQELQTREQQGYGGIPVYLELIEALRSDPDKLPTLKQVRLEDDDIDNERNFKFFIGYAIEGIQAHLTEKNQSKQD